jgi:bifunctional N-acetylglucosamine-1-phosphate-uridyltransferase/glucosamine-1-phosphate-acetyltransferase GlmU-like protein
LKDLDPKAVVCFVPDDRLGPSYAIYKAEAHVDLDQACVVNYCDFAGVFSELEYLAGLQTSDCSVLTYNGFHPHMLRNSQYAYVKKINNKVIDIQEKKSYTNDPMNEEASAGSYAFKNGQILLNAISKQLNLKLTLNGEYYTSLTVKALLDYSNLVSTYSMEKFYQWGTPIDLEEWIIWRRFIKELHEKRTDPADSTEFQSGVRLILAGGLGKRLKSSTNIPKALYPVAGSQLWTYSLDRENKDSQYLVIRPELIQSLSYLPDLRVQLIPLEQETNGQAQTAQLGLSKVSETFGQVSFLSCDNIVLDAERYISDSMSNLDWLEVWASDRYGEAFRNPSQYSWIQYNSAGKVEKYFPKQDPIEKNCSVVIGNFTFSSVHFAKKVLDICIEPHNRIMNESYIDSAIAYCLNQNVPIYVRVVRNFKAIGNELELKTFHYWNECNERKYIAWT